MAELNELNIKLGHLFKKKYIMYQSKKWKIFELVDYTAAICYINTENIKRCNIISGNYTGNLADVDSIINGDDLVFLHDNLLNVIKENKNIIDFDEIRKTQLAKLTKYCLRASDKKDWLNALQDRDFINFLEKDSAKDNLKFNETASEKNTDISTMYSSIKKTIVSQDKQIMQILTALFKNQKVVQSNLDIDLISKLKENILIYGSTGTGKTEILKRISKLYNKTC